jgi:hypothetical protein
MMPPTVMFNAWATSTGFASSRMAVTNYSRDSRANAVAAGFHAGRSGGGSFREILLHPSYLP